MKNSFWIALLVCLNVVFIRCGNNDTTAAGSDGQSTPSIPSISYTVVATHAHDTSFFTEGLEFYKGSLVESTGLEGKSKLVQYDLA